MVSKVFSASLWGIEAEIVAVEIDVASGIPKFAIVGLPETTVKEARERVESALKNGGFKFPQTRVTVNLAPADVKKEGSGFDLPIAIGILTATEQASPERLEHYLIAGELALDGRIRGIRGALCIAVKAKQSGFKGIIIPKENAKEAAVVEGIEVLPVEHISDVVEFMFGTEIEPESSDAYTYSPSDSIDFSDVKGQYYAKRALEVAAAGGHNILMIGPPGSGKTMLARRLPTILPPMTFEEAIETTRIHSVAGLLPPWEGLVLARPFRAPHHTISDAGLIGGKAPPRPGEVSYAHNGVLFLDEFPEFTRHVLEVLRQPMEDGKVTIARAGSSITYPARFMLVAAMNPCPCGYFGDAKHSCTCTPAMIERYISKISGPLLDRIDIHIEVPRVEYKKLTEKREQETSEEVRERVINARAKQLERYKNEEYVFCNAQLSPSAVEKYCTIGEESHKLLELAIERLGLSARAYHRILKVARTIADLADQQHIEPVHIQEAIQYRILDRRFWLEGGA